MLGYNRTITQTNINVLINIGPGAGGGRTRRGKNGNLPNTFDDDCSFFHAWPKLKETVSKRPVRLLFQMEEDI